MYGKHFLLLVLDNTEYKSAIVLLAFLPIHSTNCVLVTQKSLQTTAIVSFQDYCEVTGPSNIQ